ncbi:MAG: VanZ family protein [Actinomycetaceae bacterium]|nr:VanZ family protein [Actinomycetaceae bacterium]
MCNPCITLRNPRALQRLFGNQGTATALRLIVIVQNLGWSLLVGIVLFCLLAGPLYLWRTIRHEEIRLKEFGWLAAGTLYASAIIVFTTLPLPVDTEAWCARQKIRYNIIPFGFMDYIGIWAQRLPWYQLIIHRSVNQIFFNLLFFMPLGAFARLMGRGWRFVAGSALALSIYLETSQLTGQFGILPCSYRVADVDDLWINTLGAVLGAAAIAWYTRKRRLPHWIIGAHAQKYAHFRDSAESCVQVQPQ